MIQERQVSREVSYSTINSNIHRILVHSVIKKVCYMLKQVHYQEKEWILSSNQLVRNKIEWLMIIALKVQDCMKKNESTGFQLLEVNNPVNNKV